MFFGSKDEVRYERKYVVAGCLLHEAISCIKSHQFLFSEIYQHRFINNIYLDSSDFQFYNNHREGNCLREKVRVRWYGDIWGEVLNAKLEFKIKRGAVGDKLVYDLIPFFVEERFCNCVLRDVFSKSGIPDCLTNDLARLRPVLLNRYYRRYFLSFDGLYRITVDSNLEYYRVESAGLCISKFAVSSDDVIIEIKYKTSDSIQPFDLANLLPHRLTKNSKYINGIEKLYF